LPTYIPLTWLETYEVLLAVEPPYEQHAHPYFSILNIKNHRDSRPPYTHINGHQPSGRINDGRGGDIFKAILGPAGNMGIGYVPLTRQRANQPPIPRIKKIPKQNTVKNIKRQNKLVKMRPIKYGQRRR
jgi:hypothetical protein